MNSRSILVVFALIVLTTGCASYRTDSPVEFDSTSVALREPVIPVEAIEWKGEKIDLKGKKFRR